MKPNAQELACINLARRYRHKAELRRHARLLAELQTSGKSRTHRFIVPIRRWLGARSEQRSRQHLLEEMAAVQALTAALSEPLKEAQVGAVKTLSSLWRAHGLSLPDNLPEELFLTLSAWVDILHGAGTAQRLHFAERYVRAIKKLPEGQDAIAPDNLQNFFESLAAQLPPYLNADDAPECPLLAAAAQGATADAVLPARPLPTMESTAFHTRLTAASRSNKRQMAVPTSALSIHGNGAQAPETSVGGISFKAPEILGDTPIRGAQRSGVPVELDPPLLPDAGTTTSEVPTPAASRPETAPATPSLPHAIPALHLLEALDPSLARSESALGNSITADSRPQSRLSPTGHSAGIAQEEWPQARARLDFGLRPARRQALVIDPGDAAACRQADLTARNTAPTEAVSVVLSLLQAETWRDLLPAVARTEIPSLIHTDASDVASQRPSQMAPSPTMSVRRLLLGVSDRRHHPLALVHSLLVRPTAASLQLRGIIEWSIATGARAFAESSAAQPPAAEADAELPTILPEPDASHAALGAPVARLAYASGLPYIAFLDLPGLAELLCSDVAPATGIPAVPETAADIAMSAAAVETDEQAPGEPGATLATGSSNELTATPAAAPAGVSAASAPFPKLPIANEAHYEISDAASPVPQAVSAEGHKKKDPITRETAELVPDPARATTEPKRLIPERAAPGARKGYVMAHTLHPDRGYRLQELRIGQDIDAAKCAQYIQDGEEIYAIITVYGSRERLRLLKKEAWLNVRTEYDEIERTIRDLK